MKVPDRATLIKIVEAVGGDGLFSVTHHLPRVPGYIYRNRTAPIVDTINWEHPEVWDKIAPVLEEQYQYHSRCAEKAAALLEIVKQLQENNGDTDTPDCSSD